MNRDMPQRHVIDLAEEGIYADSSLGQKIIGRKETVTSFSRNDFLKYFSNFYKGENVIIGVTGNYSDEVLDRIKEGFSTTSKGKRSEVPTYKERESRGVKFQNKDTDQTHLHLGLYGVGEKDEEVYTMDVIARILGQGMISRLFQKVREEKGWAYYVKGNARTFMDTGYLGIRTGIKQNKVYEALKIIKDEIENFPDTVTEEELKRAKTSIKGSTLIDMEKTFRVALRVGYQELVFDEVKTLKKEFEKYDQVAMEDIKGFFDNYLDLSRAQLSWIGPHGEDLKEAFLDI